MPQSLFGYQLEDGKVPDHGKSLPIGKGHIVRPSGGLGSKNKFHRKERKNCVAVLSLGSCLGEVLKAANEVEERDPTR
jgi:hypothetical protein